MSTKAIICGPSDDDMVCPLCKGNNRGKQRMDECDLCAGEGTMGLFSGFFTALGKGSHRMRRYEAIRKYFTTANSQVDGAILSIIDNYERPCGQRDRRGAAISEGFEKFGHDDFNIAVWEGDRLVSWDWMDKPVDTDPDVLGQIAGDLRASL